MNEFLDVAKSLEIKEISKDVECDIADTFRGQQNDDKSIVDNEIGSNDIFSLNKNYVLEEISETETKSTGYKDATGYYQFGKCEKTFLSSSTLNRHNKSAHEGLRFPCNKCNQTFAQRVGLQAHIKSTHEGVTFSCDFCDQVFTQKSNLTTHKKNKH